MRDSNQCLCTLMLPSMIEQALHPHWSRLYGKQFLGNISKGHSNLRPY
eukprot:12215.XXX_832189_832332_1 [CDS] Oithona nana genome sequencing.